MTRPSLPLLAVCAGLSAAALARPPASVLLAASTVSAAIALACAGHVARTAVFVAIVSLAWWWGAARLDAIDRSPLLARLGTAENALVEVTAPPRTGSFDVRVDVRVLRFGALRPHEPALLELPVGRSPPLGARLALIGVLQPPRGPDNGFDERLWLRRHGMHVVVRAATWRRVGRRGGLAGLGDRLHGALAAAVGRHLSGERRGVVEGVVLGEDQGLSDGLRKSFRISGLYHLLAVSGQNVAIVAGGALVLAWLVGVPRLPGELLALLAMGGYVLAVGPQPSVIRAGVAGALGSLAWLTARLRDRWHALLVAAVVLLAWSPYNLLDPGFQLSFAAVASIFVLAPRIRRRLDGYPLPKGVADVAAISTACSLATAPVSWLAFHTIPVLSVPANLAAAPAVVPLLGFAFASAALGLVSAPAAALTAHLDGLTAAYLAGCARVTAAIPGAQIRSGRAAAAALAIVLLVAAYAWRNAQRAEAGLPAHG